MLGGEGGGVPSRKECDLVGVDLPSPSEEGGRLGGFQELGLVGGLWNDCELECSCSWARGGGRCLCGRACCCWNWYCCGAGCGFCAG